MPDEILVKVENLSVRLGGHLVLNGIDMVVRRGEIVTLIGPNGAGKSTLVRAILHLIASCKNDRDPCKNTPDSCKSRVMHAPNLCIGYVPQSLFIDPVLPLTVRRFLALAARAPVGDQSAGIPAAPVGERIETALDEVDAGETIERSIHDLSGGEFRRVLLARALLRRPDLLVLDEPVQGVDFGSQMALYQLIGRLRRRHGMGILMVSHDLHLVMAATDRVICLNGHVCCSGAPEAVSLHPEYIALFGDEAARGLAVYSHAHDHEHGLDGAVIPATHDHNQEPHDHG